MNECHFMGRLMHDPELKAVGPKGTPVVNFTIALNRKFKKANGETESEPIKLRCEAWDTGAETIARHLRKGDPIIVHCSARNDEWTDKDGNPKSTIKFRVNHFDFVLAKPKARQEEAVDEPREDEIPF